MVHAPHVLPFRRVLPFAQLLLCAVILWPLRPVFVNQIKGSLREYGLSHDAGVSNLVSPRLRSFDFSNPMTQRRIQTLEAREWVVAALNLPGGLPDLAYAVFSPAHSEWTPRGMLMWTWRDLTWPIIGMFFWWLAGRSIEALLFARHRILLPKIGWWEVLVSLPVTAFGTIWAIGMCIDQIAHAEFPLRMLLAIFGSMWMVLGASTSAAYVTQWRLRRRLAPHSLERASILPSAG